MIPPNTKCNLTTRQERALELSPRGVANIGGFRAFRRARIVPYQDDGRKEVSAPSPSGSGAKTGSKQLNAWETG